MPIYEYKCPRGHLTIEGKRGAKTRCDVCGRDAKRTWGFSMVKGDLSFEPHMNSSVGEYVSTPTGFSDALKRKSEEATASTGIEHNYEPISWQDTDAAGVTDEGLEAG